MPRKVEQISDIPHVSGIYKITCKCNNKIYIGSSTNIHVRLLNHINSLRLNCHYNRKLQEDYLKYGIDNFEFEVVETCLTNNLLDREKYYIEQIFESFNSNKGYNIAPIVNINGVARQYVPRKYYSMNDVKIVKLLLYLGLSISATQHLTKVDFSFVKRIKNLETYEDVLQYTNQTIVSCNRFSNPNWLQDTKNDTIYNTLMSLKSYGFDIKKLFCNTFWSVISPVPVCVLKGMENLKWIDLTN